MSSHTALFIETGAAQIRDILTGLERAFRVAGLSLGNEVAVEISGRDRETVDLLKARTALADELSELSLASHLPPPRERLAIEAQYTHADAAGSGGAVLKIETWNCSYGDDDPISVDILNRMQCIGLGLLGTLDGSRLEDDSDVREFYDAPLLIENGRLVTLPVRVGPIPSRLLREFGTWSQGGEVPFQFGPHDELGLEVTAGGESCRWAMVVDPVFGWSLEGESTSKGYGLAGAAERELMKLQWQADSFETFADRYGPALANFEYEIPGSLIAVSACRETVFSRLETVEGRIYSGGLDVDYLVQHHAPGWLTVRPLKRGSVGGP